MEDWEQKEAEYNESQARHRAATTELRSAFRKLEWWPELDGARRQFDEAPSFQEFRQKLQLFAESGTTENISMERIIASGFWRTHIPDDYPVPTWYQSQESPIFDAAPRRFVQSQMNASQETDPAALLSRVRDSVAELRAGLERRYDNVDEDSYASRMDARADLRFAYQFELAIAKVKPGDEVDLRRVGINYGYDAEEAYSDRSVGLEYVPAIERERSQFRSDMNLVQPFIDDLEKAGVIVRRQFRELWHEDIDPRIFRSDQVNLNRHLDLQEEAPALVGILFDVGARRLGVEERYERLHETGPDMRERLGNEIHFLARFEDMIANTTRGEIVDMRVAGLYIDDAHRAAAAKLPSGLTYVVAEDINRADYQNLLAGIEKYIPRLEAAGITVRTGYREIHAEDYVQTVVAEQSMQSRDHADRAAKTLAWKAITPLDSPARKSLHDEATMYWSNIAHSAEAATGLQQSESYIQTSARGRAR